MENIIIILKALLKMGVYFGIGSLLIIFFLLLIQFIVYQGSKKKVNPYKIIIKKLDLWR